MENNHILTNEEFEIFQKFSIKMTPNTKKDYLSKVILFKEVIKVDNILDVTKDDCKNFIEFIEDEYALSTCEKIFSYFGGTVHQRVHTRPIRHIRKSGIFRL